MRRAIIIYGSTTGNTEMTAETIEEDEINEWTQDVIDGV